jgi:predicted DNA-binding transcriptional regulator AlpA
MAVKIVSEVDVADRDQPQPIGGKMLDVAAVAVRFSISRRSVWRAVAQGDLPPPVKIGRCSRWLPADIAAFELLLLKRRETVTRTTSTSI